MRTLEEIKTFYVTARNFAKLGDDKNKQIVMDSIAAISSHCKELYEIASIVDKAKCKVQFESLDAVIEIIKLYGLRDNRVNAFFGFVSSSIDAPSFSDIMSGKAKASESKPVIKNETGSASPDLDCPRQVNANKGKKPHSPDENPTTAAPVIGGVDNIQKNDTDVDKSFDSQSLAGFIGQQHIVKPLLKEIAIAKNEGRKHLDNILLFGNPGLGKTTLMGLIAKELGVGFEPLDCSQFRNSQQSLKALQNFFMRIAKENKPVVIALDEIHMLNNELQSSLLTLLNNRVYVSPLDVNGQCKRIPIDEFTFIAATTDDDKVLDTIKNRCLRLKFQMVDYTPEELKQIYKNKVEAKGLTIDDAVIDICIPRSRGAIRYVNSIVEGLDKALYSDDGIRISKHIDLNTALNYFNEKRIDPIGLEDKDLEILKAIQDDTSGAISADVLSARVGLDTKKYLSEYERYLIKIGFISVTGRGRSLTEKAIKYLNGNSSAGDRTSTSNESNLGVNDSVNNDAASSSTSVGSADDVIGDMFGGNNG